MACLLSLPLEDQVPGGASALAIGLFDALPRAIRIELSAQQQPSSGAPIPPTLRQSVPEDSPETGVNPGVYATDRAKVRARLRLFGSRVCSRSSPLCYLALFKIRTNFPEALGLSRMRPSPNCSHEPA